MTVKTAFMTKNVFKMRKTVRAVKTFVDYFTV